MAPRSATDPCAHEASNPADGQAHGTHAQTEHTLSPRPVTGPPRVTPTRSGDRAGTCPNQEDADRRNTHAPATVRVGARLYCPPCAAFLKAPRVPETAPVTRRFRRPRKPLSDRVPDPEARPVRVRESQPGNGATRTGPTPAAEVATRAVADPWEIPR